MGVNKKIVNCQCHIFRFVTKNIHNPTFLLFFPYPSIVLSQVGIQQNKLYGKTTFAKSASVHIIENYSLYQMLCISLQS